MLKKGIALTPVKFGISFTLIHLNQAGALVHVYRDGSISLNHGGTEMGQGLFVKVAQVVAEEFGVDLDQVKITATSTAKVPNTGADGRLGRHRPQRPGGARRLPRDQGAALRLHPGEVGASAATASQFRDGKVLIGNEAIELRPSSPMQALCRPRLAVLDRLLQDAEDRLGPRRRPPAGRSTISPMARPARR